MKGGIDIKITIECNEKQSAVIKEALDLYSRLLMGQLRELDNFFTRNTDCWKHPNSDCITNCAETIKNIVYPELKGYDSFGIFNEKCPEESKIAYDIIQVLRYELIKVRDPERKTGWSIDWSYPTPASKENLINIKIN
jgi:hypothetical protein